MNEATRRGGQFALATVLAVAAYHLSVFGILFLLPLQWVRSRRGEAPFVGASLLAVAGIAAVEAVIKAVMKSPWTLVDTVVVGLPAVIVVGWVAIVLLERTGWRFLYRALAVTAAAGLVLFPLTAYLMGNGGFVKSLENAFDAVWNQVFQTPGLDARAEGLNQNDFFELLKQTFLSSFLAVLFLFWMFTGRLSKSFETGKSDIVKNFRVPAQGAWVLLGLWGLILARSLLHRAGVTWDWGMGDYVVLNLAWIALAVHALAGWGIVESLMQRWRWPGFGRLVVRAALALLLVTQGAGQVVVLVGLPLLAVLELWVNLRTTTQEVGQ